MITTVQWSRLSLGILIVAAIASPKTDTAPVAVLAGFQEQLATTPAFRATVWRKQSFRSVERGGRGTLLFHHSFGSRYEWKSPGHYLFLASDTLLCGIDLRKRCGWHHNNGRRRYQIDPLWRLMELRDIDRDRFTYRGNSDSLLYFSLRDNDGGSRTIGLDALRERCHIIERFDNEGILTEKILFTYHKKSIRAVVPSAIIITERFGPELSVDTILLNRQRDISTVKHSAFSLPEGIRWNTGTTNGCSMQQ